MIEAMYFGKPVLLSTHTSLPEIGGDAAYYFENFEPQHMQERLKKALQDYKTNERVDAIKNRAFYFDWKNTAAQYLEVYDKLLEKN